MEPLFGYDLVNGELVENHIEADFVRFQFALEIGKKPEPPRHMVESIKKLKEKSKRKQLKSIYLQD